VVQLPLPRKIALPLSALPAVNALRSATQEARPVRVRYVTADGQSAERDLAPLDLGAGAIRAVDRDTAQVVTIPLARISSVFPVTLGD